MNVQMKTITVNDNLKPIKSLAPLASSQGRVSFNTERIKDDEKEFKQIVWTDQLKNSAINY